MSPISIIKKKFELFVLQKRFRDYFTFQKEVLKNNNLIIEFMGPPGVGKTTYAEALKRKLCKEYNIITSTEINKLQRTKLREYSSYSNFHGSLYTDFLNYMTMDKSATGTRINKTRFGLLSLECDAMATHFIGLVINDEGISHHFTELLIKNFKNNMNEGFNEILQNRLIIFLTASNEVILDRIKTRYMESNYIWQGHNGISRDEIISITEDDIKIKNELVNMISIIKGSAILMLNSEECQERNIELVYNSIREA